MQVLVMGVALDEGKCGYCGQVLPPRKPCGMIIADDEGKAKTAYGDEDRPSVPNPEATEAVCESCAHRLIAGD